VPTEKRQRQKEGQRARREQALAELRRRQRRRRLQLTAIFAVVLIGILLLVSVVGGDDKDTKKLDLKVAGGKTLTVEVPKDSPTNLETTDLKVGKGKAAKLGSSITVNYVGVSWKDGKQFDSSFGKAPVTFELSKGQLIDGWINGIPGMKVGGRRQLIIPGKEAYGDKDTGDGRPHGPLVFVIDLVSVK